MAVILNLPLPPRNCARCCCCLGCSQGGKRQTREGKRRVGKWVCVGVRVCCRSACVWCGGRVAAVRACGTTIRWPASSASGRTSNCDTIEERRALNGLTHSATTLSPSCLLIAFLLSSTVAGDVASRSSHQQSAVREGNRLRTASQSFYSTVAELLWGECGDGAACQDCSGNNDDSTGKIREHARAHARWICKWIRHAAHTVADRAPCDTRCLESWCGGSTCCSGGQTRDDEQLSRPSCSSIVCSQVDLGCCSCAIAAAAFPARSLDESIRLQHTRATAQRRAATAAPFQRKLELQL
jgi:hypothetical protein